MIKGLEIKGKKVGILLDSSSSMTDEKLIDIIKRKTQSDDNIKKSIAQLKKDVHGAKIFGIRANFLHQKDLPFQDQFVLDFLVVSNTHANKANEWPQLF